MDVQTNTSTEYKTMMQNFVAEPSLSCLQKVVQMMFAKALHESFVIFDELNRDIYAALMCITKLDRERSEVVDEIIASINEYLETNKPSPSLLFNLLRVTEKTCEATSTEDLQYIYDLVLDRELWSYPYVFDESDEMYAETIVQLYADIE